MSNKTQLQTNNTTLDSLISRVNAAKDVAASLPEAGSSSGGVELCYCTIVCDAPASGTHTITYTTEGMQLATEDFEIMSGTQVEVVKGTIVTLTPWSSQSECSGDCTKIFTLGVCGSYFINGDSTLRYG